MSERGMADVLSSELTQCLGSLLCGGRPGAWEAEQSLLWAEAVFPPVAPMPSISTDATMVLTVAQRISIFAKYQLFSS